MINYPTVNSLSINSLIKFARVCVRVCVRACIVVSVCIILSFGSNSFLTRQLLLLWKSNKYYRFLWSRACVRVCVCEGAWACRRIHVVPARV
jgi:hypothetical protein